LYATDPVYKAEFDKTQSTALAAIKALTVALEAGGYNVAPSNLQQGCCGLKVESLEATMKMVTFSPPGWKPSLWFRFQRRFIYPLYRAWWRWRDR
jgi:hypothetical protein